MKESYIAKDFRKTAAQCFPEKADALCAAFDARLNELRAEYADVSDALRQHLESQIMPGIAAYETLQSVMPKDEALGTVHGYVEALSRQYHKYFVALLRLPGLYRVLPGFAAKATRKNFGTAAGFAATELRTDKDVWRVDMTKCPYHDACVKHGCPELCPCFCDSDDVSYSDLHPKLVWHRETTLGRGGNCCDFCLKIAGK